MVIPQPRIVGTGLLFLLVFISGFWLNRSGSPYSVAILTLHKLISLAAAGLVVVTIVQTNRVARLGATELVVSVASGLFFVAAVATGGLLSAEKPMPAIVSTLHLITPFLTVLSTAVTLYLLANSV